MVKPPTPPRQQLDLLSAPRQVCPRCRGQLIFEDNEWAICLHCGHRVPQVALESLPSDEAF